MTRDLSADVGLLAQQLGEDTKSLEVIDVVLADDGLDIRINDKWAMRMEFLDAIGPFAEQAVEGLSQVQDVITEWLTEPWPACPEHHHALEPVSDGGLVWRCPTDASIARPLGGLSGS